ncbi:serine hydrolase domain-containing protein [Alkalihalobacillus pseudalcaliphilus]|uniref:serine hydrolase domain-containing protein n=1 Tax=Alkalihalobacillus pseudalcaliphilus TaxID=79884 RepID=UPI00064D9CC7|nr:serine hydrolase [Alkalihalobacillus pseudalcaliphilus]KMK77522.1 hypothetical protein AB990_03375 [Alkalihalobacillus pseudalcaliphilus]
MKKRTKLGLGAGITLSAFAAYKVFQNYQALTLFHPTKRVERFQHMDKVMPFREIEPSKQPFQFTENLDSKILTYTYKGNTRSVDSFLEQSETTGFLFIQDDQVLYETYRLGSKPTSTFTSWSVAKSMVSAMVGVALEEGLIKSIEEPIGRYVPELNHSGYGDVSIKNVLLMSSGVRFNEEYANKKSDIQQIFYQALLWDQSADRFMKKLKNESGAGERFHYISSDTQALGMLIRNVTGRQPSRYFEEKIWKQIGTENRAFWSQDRKGNDFSFCGFNATLRDYAKFGRLFCQEGKWEEEQLVSNEWVRQSTTIHQDSLLTGRDSGYQYQWWVPYRDNQDFLALGVWGQFLYVHPKTRTIIVKTSADPDYSINEQETIALLRSLATSTR